MTYAFKEQHLILHVNHITFFCLPFSKPQRVKNPGLGCSSGMVEVGKYYIHWEKGKTTEQDESADLGIPQLECDDQGIVL